MKDLMIMCFGDSITYGYCAEYGTDYVSLFKKKVSEDFAGENITIRNRGVNGESSRDGLARIDNELESYSPDLVIMLFGSNDSAYSSWYHVGYEEFSHNYDLIISKIKSEGAEIILITPPPVIEDNDVPFIENSVLEGYCDIIKEKSDKFGLPLIDMNKAFKEHGALPELLQWDGIHISTEGYRLFFDTVYKTARPIIENMLKN